MNVFAVTMLCSPVYLAFIIFSQLLSINLMGYAFLVIILAPLLFVLSAVTYGFFITFILLFLEHRGRLNNFIKISFYGSFGIIFNILITLWCKAPGNLCYI